MPRRGWKHTVAAGVLCGPTEKTLLLLLLLLHRRSRARDGVAAVTELRRRARSRCCVASIVRTIGWAKGGMIFEFFFFILFPRDGAVLCADEKSKNAIME
jgi:hypothetical protein